MTATADAERATGERAAARLEALARDDPGVAPLALAQAAVFRAAADPAWDRAVPALDGTRLSEGLPLLHGQALALPLPALAALARELARAIGAAGGHLGQTLATADLDLPGLVEASVCQDAARLAALAAAARIDAEPLATFAGLLAQPLLLAVGRAAAPVLTGASWDAGYCPVCAAWPALAERRGLDRARWLRCGRCAAAWTYYLQKCPFCANSDFRTLGYLAPEANREAQQAATCDACHSYLKAVATVAPLAAEDLALRDLATLELDLAALEQGYARPEAPGFPLSITVTGTPGPEQKDGGERKKDWLPWRR